MKFGSDPGPSAPRPALFPLHSLPLPQLSTSLPLLTSPPLSRPLRPTSPLSSPPLPSVLPSLWLRPRQSHVVGLGSRGRRVPGRPPQLGSAVLRCPALGACAPCSALPALRSPPAAPRQEARLAAGGIDKGGAAQQSQRAGARTMDSERGRPAPALRTRRSRARP